MKCSSHRSRYRCLPCAAVSMSAGEEAGVPASSHPSWSPLLTRCTRVLE